MTSLTDHGDLGRVSVQDLGRARDSVRREGTGRESTGRESTGRESTGREGTGRDGVRREEFRALFRRHAAGVTVVTLASTGVPVGFTATSVASLAAEPPLVSFGVAATSSSAPALLVADTVVINLLGAGQEEIAARFATSGVDRFAPPVRWSLLPTGEPHLRDAPAWLRARVEHRLAVGDHYLVVARVVETTIASAAQPLVYHDGRYGTLVPSDGR